MGNFKIVKKGYSQLEVDSFIERLKTDYEGRLAEQKDRIFYLKDQVEKLTSSSDNELMASLLTAVEKAKMIENSSKNIYELETKKLNLLYNKMENLLKEENVANSRSVKNELLSLIQDCRNSLQHNIEKQSKNIKESSSGDPVKRLLSKMMGINTFPQNFDTRENENNVEEKTVTPPIKQEKESQIKVVQIKRQEQKRPEPKEFNKFLSNKNTLDGSNFEHIMFTNKNGFDSDDSGFDLKEAVNPKEDLEEIMKAFDFYNDAKKDE